MKKNVYYPQAGFGALKKATPCRDIRIAYCVMGIAEFGLPRFARNDGIKDRPLDFARGDKKRGVFLRNKKAVEMPISTASEEYVCRQRRRRSQNYNFLFIFPLFLCSPRFFVL